MSDSKMKLAYESMACFLDKDHRLPGVEDAFAQGTYCESRYQEIWDIYEHLRDRLEAEEIADMDRMINAFDDLQRELCYRMYRYGAQFGE